MKKLESVNIEVATKEIEDWLDYKKINDRKRDAYRDQIDTLIDAVMDGTLMVDEGKSFVQTLKFPTEGETPVTKLEFKPRIKMKSILKQLQGVKSNDADGRLIAYVAALTSQPKGVIQDLDTEDYAIGQSIAIFFL